MDHPFSHWDRKYTRDVAALAPRFRLYQREENAVFKMISSQKKEAPMKYRATVAVLLTFGVAVVSAEENTGKMTFSGISGPTVVNLLQPNSSDGEDNFAGSGPLGSFTVRNIRVFPNNPPAVGPSSCSSANQIYFTESAGGGIVRFQEGPRRQRRPSNRPGKIH
jgi:hypothetical protein